MIEGIGCMDSVKGISAMMVAWLRDNEQRMGRSGE